MTKSDPALCKRLAEFMGWKRIGWHWYDAQDKPTGFRLAEALILEPIDRSEPLLVREAVLWNPPENIAQAMMVLTKLAKRGQRIKIDIAAERVLVEINEHAHGADVSERAATVEMAAALAADAWLRQGGGG